MANYTQYIPQVNSTTYPTSINNCFTALTTDVTALETEITNARNGEVNLLDNINLKLSLTGGIITGSVIFNAIPAFNGGTSGTTAPFTVDSTQVVINLNANLLGGQEGNWYAPIASPVFTGTPSLPAGSTGVTQSINDNSISLATTAYVDNKLIEGVWSPILGSLTTNATMSAQEGKYFKNGRLVTCIGRLSVTDITGISGDIYIKNLPYTSEANDLNLNYTKGNVNIATSSGLSITAGQSLTGHVVDNSTNAELGIWSSAGGNLYLNASEITSVTSFSFSITYIAAA